MAKRKAPSHLIEPAALRAAFISFHVRRYLGSIVQWEMVPAETNPEELLERMRLEERPPRLFPRTQEQMLAACAELITPDIAEEILENCCEDMGVEWLKGRLDEFQAKSRELTLALHASLAPETVRILPLPHKGFCFVRSRLSDEDESRYVWRDDAVSWNFGRVQEKFLVSLLEGTWEMGKARHLVARDRLCALIEQSLVGIKARADKTYEACMVVNEDLRSTHDAEHVAVFSGDMLEPHCRLFHRTAFGDSRFINPTQRILPSIVSKIPFDVLTRGETLRGKVVELLQKKTSWLLVTFKDEPTLFLVHAESQLVGELPPDSAGTILF